MSEIPLFWLDPKISNQENAILFQQIRYAYPKLKGFTSLSDLKEDIKKV